MWLGVFLLIIYVFSMVHLLRGAIIWIIFLWLGYMVWFMKKDLMPYLTIISDVAQEFRGSNLKTQWWKWIGIVLLAISLMYYLYGFQLSYIPYSTAWDANHAYMYIPKVLAQNHGVMWWDIWWVASMASWLWHMFITFWFALFTPIKSWFWIAPDTIAVAMNFLSGIFVLIFGTWLIKEVVSYFASKKDEDDTITTIGMYSWWMMLLFWLTSWMGAFLVFVDNKTDLGVMTLTILALLSGFIFLKHILDNREHGLKLNRDSLKYIIISGVMFARALMAKQTAFIDIALFALLLVGLWIDSIIAIGLGIMTIGATGILKIANAPDMMNPITGKYIVGIWAIVVVVWIIKMVMNKHIVQKSLSDKKQLLKYILIWWVALVATLFVFKWPNLLIYQINNGSFSPWSFIKSVLLGKNNTPKLLLATRDTTALTQQTTIDKAIINTLPLSVDQCKGTTFTEEELATGTRKAISSNEDVGRYVGYGWKEITKWPGLNLWYGLLRLFYPKNNECYGTNSQAKLLCKNAQAIDNFNVPTLQTLFAQVKKGTDAYNLLSGALAAYQQKWSGIIINPTEYRDYIVALRQYYQNHSIKTDAGKINIPYRYLIPFNVTFNRSLQNLSSYYTDIWFVWLLLFMLLILGFFYTLFNQHRYKQDNNLMVLSSITIIWRGVWWIIWWGIVWYGMGLVVWTVIAVAMILRDIFQHSEDESQKTMMYIILFLLAIRWLIQFTLNFVRISSQWGGGPFLRYKMNNGKTTEITTTLQQKEVVKVGYGQQDVFDLQFPHYNKFIDYVKNRKNTDGVLIAGTYMQYFLDNQWNIKGDGMLSWFREQNSDGNMCKSYQRLRNSNLKYLVIDPNIGTVVMGEGNESLFNRFFAKKDPVTWKIQEDGAISNLVKLRKAWYISLFSTNNLWAKYAFSLDDAVLKAKFGNMSEDELIFLRAKLSIARFFPDAQELLNFIWEVFTSRINNGLVIGDIADVYGKTIDEKNVATIAQKVLAQQGTPEELSKTVEWLSQDERLILTQYLGLFNLLKANNPQYQEFINNILWQSLGGGSQLIVFELN